MVPPKKLRLAHARPDDEHVLLLRAALLDGDPAREAYSDWSAGRDLTELDQLSQNLLPLLYRNLKRLGVEDGHHRLVQQAWRRTWVTNTQLFHAAGQAVAALSTAGIPVVLTKGAALVAHGSTADLGSRVMSDVDALVPFADADHAAEVLQASGWRLHYARSWEQERARGHSAPFEDAQGRQLDLHWRALFDPADDTQLLSRREPAKLLDQDVFVPSAADQLVLSCLHGNGWHGAPLRWVVDSTLILQHHDVDWNVVVTEGRHRGSSHRLATLLELLNGIVDPLVPQEVIDELRSSPLTTYERGLQRAKDSSHWGTTIYACSIDHARRSRALGVKEPWMAFAMLDLGLDRRGQLAKRVVTRPFRHVRWITRGRQW